MGIGELPYKVVERGLCMSRKVRLLYENRCIGRVAEFRLEDLGF